MANSVTITVGSADPIEVPWYEDMNVQDALEDAYDKTEDAIKFSFALEYFGVYQGAPYGPLGYMVIMLDGTFDLPGEGMYWALLINGNYATKGIDSTFLSPGDKVAFVNEPYSDEKHKDTAVGLKHRYRLALKLGRAEISRPA